LHSGFCFFFFFFLFFFPLAAASKAGSRSITGKSAAVVNIRRPVLRDERVASPESVRVSASNCEPSMRIFLLLVRVGGAAPARLAGPPMLAYSTVNT
jgi:hypothetical protein